MSKGTGDETPRDTDPVTALVSFRAEAGSPVSVQTEGLSMGRCLLPPCDVVVSPLTGRPRPGDVVVFRADHRSVCHRVIWWDAASDCVVTKGDHALQADRRVPVSDIIGRATAIRREGSVGTPWHWRRPLCRLVAILSRIEAAAWPRMPALLRAIHLRWRLGWQDRLVRQCGPEGKPPPTDDDGDVRPGGVEG